MPSYPSHPQRKRPKPPARDPERHTLVKYLVAAGLGSRRHCAALVMSGYVTVNGGTADSLMMEVSHRDRIEVDGRPVLVKRGAHVYLAVNKPDAYLSAVSDDRERQTVLDLVPRALRVNGLVPAGRLDLHSTGLILLTNDGELVNRITHPRYEVEKEYHVALDRGVQPTQSSQLRTGVEIEGGTAHAKALRRLQDEPGYRYSITLVEGKKREVRLMFREVGRRVLELQRVRIGTLLLGTLGSGDVRELTDREISDLKRLVGIYAPRPEPTTPSPAVAKRAAGPTGKGASDLAGKHVPGPSGKRGASLVDKRDRNSGSKNARGRAGKPAAGFGSRQTPRFDDKRAPRPASHEREAVDEPDLSRAKGRTGGGAGSRSAPRPTGQPSNGPQPKRVRSSGPASKPQGQRPARPAPPRPPKREGRG